jgi:hypothetical protein
MSANQTLVVSSAGRFLSLLPIDADGLLFSSSLTQKSLPRIANQCFFSTRGKKPNIRETPQMEV